MTTKFPWRQISAFALALRAPGQNDQIAQLSSRRVCKLQGRKYRAQRPALVLCPPVPLWLGRKRKANHAQGDLKCRHRLCSSWRIAATRAKKPGAHRYRKEVNRWPALQSMPQQSSRKFWVGCHLGELQSPNSVRPTGWLLALLDLS